MSLLIKNVLNDELFNDITELTDKDKKLNPDLVILNYLYFTSFFCSRKIQLQTGDARPTNSNLFTFVAGNSGFGKSYSNSLFFRPIMDIQKRLHLEHLEKEKFVKSCTEYIKDFPDFTENYKQEFVKKYNENNGTNFEKFTIKGEKEHIFLTTDFTPEKLSIVFESSKNNTILLNCDEFETLQNNLNRTSTVSNIFTYLTSYFDGKDDYIIRKNSDSTMIDNGFISLLTNTTIDTFNKVKNSDFFKSGLGYRYLFFIQSDFELKDPEETQISHKKISHFDQYQKRISHIFETFFFDQVYNNDNDILTLWINRPETLKYYNVRKVELWEKHIKNNKDLSTSQKQTILSRLDTMFNKCILNNYLMNYSYNSPVFPLNKTELDIIDIDRGFYTYDYFLSNMMDIFKEDSKTDLNENQQKVIELLVPGGEMLVPELRQNVIRQRIMSDKSFSRLMNTKSNQFEVIEEYDYTLKKKVRRIRRYGL